MKKNLKKIGQPEAYVNKIIDQSMQTETAQQKDRMVK